MKVGSLYLEIIKKCNMSCKYCYNGSSLDDVYLDYSIIDEIFNSCKILGINNIAISGGEPYLNKDIIPIISLGYEKNFDNLFIITNGISGKIIDYAKYISKVNFIQISLDSINPRINDVYRGLGSCVKVKQTIEKLCILGYNNKIVLNCVISNINTDEIKDLVNYGLSKKIKGINFEFLLLQGNATYKMIINENQMYEIQNHIKNIQKELKGKIDITIPSIKSGCPFLNGIYNVAYPKIDCFGNVYVCDGLVETKYIIGNIKEEKLEDILREERIRAKQPIFNEAKMKCNQCIDSKNCPGNCLIYCDESRYKLNCTTCLYKKISFPRKILFEKISF